MKFCFMHPIDKTRTMFLEEFFILKGTWEEKKKGVSNPPQWDGFLKVLNTSDLKFLSLVGVENPDKHRTQRELTKWNDRKFDNDNGSNSDQENRSRVM